MTDRYLVAVAISTTTRTAASAAAAATREFAAGSARFHRLGFVDGEVTAVMILAMQRLDGLLALFGIAHGDEAEAAGAVGFAIHDQVGFGDGAVLGEQGVERLFSGLEGKISYVQFHTILIFCLLRLRPHATIEVRAHAHMRYQ